MNNEANRLTVNYLIMSVSRCIVPLASVVGCCELLSGSALFRHLIGQQPVARLSISSTQQFAFIWPVRRYDRATFFLLSVAA